jgi:hypothetical protein
MLTMPGDFVIAATFAFHGRSRRYQGMRLTVRLWAAASSIKKQSWW